MVTCAVNVLYIIMLISFFVCFSCVALFFFFFFFLLFLFYFIKHVLIAFALTFILNEIKKYLTWFNLTGFFWFFLGKQKKTIPDWFSSRLIKNIHYPVAYFSCACQQLPPPPPTPTPLPKRSNPSHLPSCPYQQDWVNEQRKRIIKNSFFGFNAPKSITNRTIKKGKKSDTKWKY